MKSTVMSIIIAGAIIGGAIVLSGGGYRNGEDYSVPANNVSIVDGRQFVAISAKGGYVPKVSVAKADVPTTLKVETAGTFDCSAALVIPAIGYRSNLPLSGTTDIELPPQKAGTTIQGLCSMGMYSFSVKFQ
jgi:plastocyanin domain-containing protein